jgi:hypothetical protein
MEPLRFSRLKAISRSPLHYQHGLTATYDSPSMRLGRLTHHLTLGTSGYAIFAGTRRSKAWDEFEANAKSRSMEAYTSSEYDTARYMRDAVMGNEQARYLMTLPGQREKTLTWKLGSRDCAGTPDGFGDRYVFDLKTCRTSEPSQFQRDARRMRYVEQLAWYADGIGLAGLGNIDELYLVAVESAAPYPVTVHQLTERAIEMGRRTLRLWLEQLAVCEASRAFPGYAQSVCTFDVDDADDFDFDSLTFNTEEAAA